MSHLNQQPAHEKTAGARGESSKWFWGLWHPPGLAFVLLGLQVQTDRMAGLARMGAPGMPADSRGVLQRLLWGPVPYLASVVYKAQDQGDPGSTHWVTLDQSPVLNELIR